MDDGRWRGGGGGMEEILIGGMTDRLIGVDIGGGRGAEWMMEGGRGADVACANILGDFNGDLIGCPPMDGDFMFGDFLDPKPCCSCILEKLIGGTANFDA